MILQVDSIYFSIGWTHHLAFLKSSNCLHLQQPGSGTRQLDVERGLGVWGCRVMVMWLNGSDGFPMLVSWRLTRVEPVERWIHLGLIEIDLMFGGSRNLERLRILWLIPFGHDSDFMLTYLCHEWWNRVISLVISSVWLFTASCRHAHNYSNVKTWVP